MFGQPEIARARIFQGLKQVLASALGLHLTLICRRVFSGRGQHVERVQVGEREAVLGQHRQPVQQERTHALAPGLVPDVAKSFGSIRGAGGDAVVGDGVENIEGDWMVERRQIVVAEFFLVPRRDGVDEIARVVAVGVNKNDGLPGQNVADRERFHRGAFAAAGFSEDREMTKSLRFRK